MKLRTKVLVVGACTTATILCLTYLVAQLVVLRSFASLETRQTRRHVERASAALAQRIDRLAVSAKDWAAWDDTYAFAEEYDGAYAASNLVPSTLSTLGIDVLAYLDTSGEVIHVMEAARSDTRGGLGASLVDALWSADGAASANALEPLSGTLSLPQGLVLVATHPILRSDLSGPSRGTLVMARLLDGEEVALLSDIARLPIEVVPLGAAQPGDVTVALAQGEDIGVRALDPGTIAGYASVRDVWGSPVASLQITLPREMFAQGRNTVLAFLVTLALGTILPIGAAVLILHKRVAGPVADLSALVNGVRQSGDLAARAAADGTAEIASLGHSINAMLEALERSEHERRLSEERYRSLVENLRDVVYTISPTGTVTFASRAVQNVIGLGSDEVVGQPFTQFVHPDDHERMWRVLEAVVAGESREDECRLVTAGGDVRWAWLSARPLLEGDGIVGLQGMLTDVTERRHLEEQLRQAQKMEAIGQLAEGIAHDFNNLLTVINGYAAATLQAMDPSDPLREDIVQIHRAGERGVALARRLLTLGRRRMGTPQVIALGEALTQTSDMLRRLMGSAISVVLDLPTDELYVQAEPGQIEQVIMNLAINARDAMPDGGTLTIQARVETAPTPGEQPTKSPAPEVVLAVQDAGCGMTPEVMQHAFEPFFTTKGPGKGTGLGLATVYGIVRQNRGSVSLDSSAGKGTTVTMRFPAEAAPVAAPRRADSRPSALPGGTERVLVVEDQHEVRQLAQRMLRRMGYCVEAAGNPTEVLAQYNPSERRYDLVLSDVAMPEMSGPELVTRLRERGNGFAVVYMSGYAEDCVLRRNALGPNDRFLQKPFSAEQLATAIRSALDRVPAGARQPEIAA